MSDGAGGFGTLAPLRPADRAWTLRNFATKTAQTSQNTLFIADKQHVPGVFECENRKDIFGGGEPPLINKDVLAYEVEQVGLAPIGQDLEGGKSA